MRKEWLLILGSMLVAGALYNHYMGHSALLIELIMLGAGAALVLLSVRFHATDEDVTKHHGIFHRALARVTTEAWAERLMPLMGFVILLAWSGYKIIATGETNLRMEDIIVTLFGFSLVLYESGPSKIQQVKDFVTMYLMLLVIVFVIIWKTYSILTGESYYRITSYAEYYMVTSPVAAILNFFGFQVNAVLDLDGIGLSNIIEYFHDGSLLRVGIGVGCSGLYSAGLFFSAFLAFVMVRYERFDRYIGLALSIGFAVTWLSNIVRMVVTVMTGILWGHPALALVHSYIGIIIFVSLITTFWILITRWLDSIEGECEPPVPPARDEETMNPDSISSDDPDSGKTSTVRELGVPLHHLLQPET